MYRSAKDNIFGNMCVHIYVPFSKFTFSSPFAMALIYSKSAQIEYFSSDEILR